MSKVQIRADNTFILFNKSLPLVTNAILEYAVMQTKMLQYMYHLGGKKATSMFRPWRS
jgi:hypothetical protein